MKVRILGDCHGHTTQNHGSMRPEWQNRTYLSLINEPEVAFSVQLGDLGFNYEFLKDVDPARHMIIGGNHDNYDVIETGEYPHFLGDYGPVVIEETHGWKTNIPLAFFNEVKLKFFFVRGAYSIDKSYRLRMEAAYGPNAKSWWIQEQMNYATMTACLEAYEEEKPDLVLSHDAPVRCMQQLTEGNGFKINNQSDTEKLLDLMFSVHKPKRWICGHFHTSKTFDVEGCEFTCLNELEYLDFDV